MDDQDVPKAGEAAPVVGSAGFDILDDFIEHLPKERN